MLEFERFFRPQFIKNALLWVFFYCEVGSYQYNVFRSGGNKSKLLRIQYTYMWLTYINSTFPDIKILSKILLLLNLGLCIDPNSSRIIVNPTYPKPSLYFYLKTLLFFQVFIAELMRGAGKAWHKGCFTCNLCTKRLDSSMLCEREGEIYCKACYGKNFGPSGFGFGMGTMACK